MHYLYLNIHIATLIHAHSFFYTGNTTMLKHSGPPMKRLPLSCAGEELVVQNVPPRATTPRACTCCICSCISKHHDDMFEWLCLQIQHQKRYQLSLTWSSKYWLRKPGCGKPIAAIINILWNPVIKYSTARSARALQQIQPWFSLLCMPPFRIASKSQTRMLSWQ